MEISDWVLVGTTLLLGTIALLAPVVSEAIKRKLFSPQITVSFEEIAPFCHKTYYRKSTDPNFEIPVFFFRFNIKNTGKSELKLCEAVLEQLWLYNSAGIPHRFSGFNDISLVWEDGRPSKINLNPNRGRHCNIGHITPLEYFKKEEAKYAIDIPGTQENKPRFMFELSEYPHSQPNCLIPGKYAIKISLYSENAPTNELWFEIAWSGKWQENESDMFRELTIRQISRIPNSI